MALEFCFEEAGTLGVNLGRMPGVDTITLTKITPGTQASRLADEGHAGLEVGLVLETVDGVRIGGTDHPFTKTYNEVMQMIKAAGRPLTLGFGAGLAPPEPAAEPILDEGEDDVDETPLWARTTVAQTADPTLPIWHPDPESITEE